MIERTVTVPAGPDRVWEALTDPDEMEAWLGGRLDWALEEGAGLRFEGGDGEHKEGRVEQVEPMRALRFRWWDTGTDAAPLESEVQYVLEPDDDGTRLTVREAVVAAPDPAAAPVATPAAPPVASASCAVPAGSWGPLDALLFELEVTAYSHLEVTCGLG